MVLEEVFEISGERFKIGVVYNLSVVILERWKKKGGGGVNVCDSFGVIVCDIWMIFNKLVIWGLL